MIIQVDTREHEGKNDHILQSFDEMGIKHVNSKLFVGDYARLDNQTVVVDRKKDVLELAGNICGKQHERFRNELIRAQECGIKLIVLVEEMTDLIHWESKRTQVKGETLRKCCLTMMKKYGCEFRFCNKEDTAQIIVNILEGIK